MSNYHAVNCEVMNDTMDLCEVDFRLKKVISDSVRRQFMVAHSENIDQPQLGDSRTKYYMTGERTFSEARKWIGGRKVAVLNFANNHSIGGAPYSAGAQEESLCRCSTLLPCLERMEETFYQPHSDLSSDPVFSQMGSDDLIYTPDVCVFKEEERRGDLIIASKMSFQDWFLVDVITCAAPDFRFNPDRPDDYEQQIGTRIKKILDVAKKQNVDILILGAWGCGAFKNPSDIVARVFHSYLSKYDFSTVVFAMGTEVDENSPFYLEFKDPLTRTAQKDRIIELLRSTGRRNVYNVIDYMEKNGFFEAPASVVWHHNFKGGLAKHSLEVYEEAMKQNEQKGMGIPQESIILSSLLHDICKTDQYYIDESGKPASNKEKIDKGHGQRSMFILMRGCKLPLNYDEAMAVWWHMGKNEVSKKRYEKEFQDSLTIPLCQVVCKADGISAHQ